jgi:hypothetical protein
MATFKHDVAFLIAVTIMPAIFTYLLYVARTVGRKELCRKEEVATRNARNSTS